ncbi:hypothetical protein [Rhizobium phage RHph_N46]|nr:hypothetical protein [Rhizobium phage RHph_N46]
MTKFDLRSYMQRVVRNDGPQTHVAGFHFDTNITKAEYLKASDDLPYERVIYSYVASTQHGSTLVFFSVGPNERIAAEEYQRALNLVLPIVIGAEYAFDSEVISTANRIFRGDFTYVPRALHDADDCKWLNRVFEGLRHFDPAEAFTDYQVTGTSH